MLAYVLQGLGFGFVAAMQPGPFQAFVLSQSLQRGWRHTLPAALAPLISDGPIIALVLLVLTQVPAWFQRALSIAGGLFMIYLAWGIYVSWRSSGREAAGLVDASAAGRGLLKAAFTNVLSPGPYLFWSLVTGPILLAGWRQAPANGVGFLAGFYGAMVVSSASLIVLFGAARQLGPRVSRALLGLSGLTMFGFGFYQLWRGFLA